MTTSPQTFSRVFPIINTKGLHARASVKFVQTAAAFKSEVSVSRGDETVNGLSIMGLLTLAAAIGTTIEVTVTGEDAEACIDALEALVADRFGEEE
ncbi:MAG: HPr family phosphocarrier protein [Methylobacteriaceae bacterium]|jgi:phosphocarrier protein|nr:HPr family phosphocarrier protein [Methylobacteriaceae bacterium]